MSFPHVCALIAILVLFLDFTGSVVTVLLKQMLNGGPDSNVYGANMEPTWGQQDPGGPHVGPMNFAIQGAS